MLLFSKDPEVEALSVPLNAHAMEALQRAAVRATPSDPRRRPPTSIGPAEVAASVIYVALAATNWDADALLELTAELHLRVADAQTVTVGPVDLEH